jgi:hypothetical protein
LNGNKYKLLKNLLRLIAVFCALSVIPAATHAQSDTGKPLRIAVLAPLYTDSAFNGYTYKLGSRDLPRQMIPGLEFYNGVMLAVDSLQKEHITLDLWVYDTKQKSQTLEQTLQVVKTSGISLIIASFNNTAEQKTVADFAFSQNIPVISATYPNEAGVSVNPFFIMLNSSLKTHVEGVYNFARRNANSRYIYFTRKGVMEDKIKEQFAELDKKLSPPLKYKVVTLNDDITDTAVLKYMDSTRINYAICGSISETFGYNLVKAIGSNSAYKTTLIGMPTWDAVSSFNKAGNSNVEIVYSTPYNYSKTAPAYIAIARNYRTKLDGKPTDMVYKGFEALYRFSKLLIKYRGNFLNNLSDNAFRLFNEFRFEPVMLNDSSFAPDYLENKKLYFMHKQDGVLKSVN